MGRLQRRRRPRPRQPPAPQLAARPRHAREHRQRLLMNPSGAGDLVACMADHITLLPPLTRGSVDSDSRARRVGRPRRKGSLITSLQLTPEERELLERLADAADTSFAEVWRKALRLYAAQN